MISFPLIGEKYSDDQERDDAGRWTAGGGDTYQPKVSAKLQEAVDQWTEEAWEITDAQRTILAKAISASAMTDTVYRGMALFPEAVAALKVGETIDLGVSSTSLDMGTATDFAIDSPYVTNADYEEPGGAKSVVFAIEGPKRGFILPDQSQGEDEVLIRGRFEITEVATGASGDVDVTMHQVADLAGTKDPPLIGEQHA